MSKRRIRLPGRRGVLRLLGVLMVLAASASVAAGASAKAAHPLTYTFRITAFDVTATFTYGKSTVKTRLRLEAPSKERTLAWLGRKATIGSNGFRAASVWLVGEATYSSPDPSCSRKLAVRSRPIPVVLFYFGARFNVYVQKFPLATAYGGQDSGRPDDLSSNRCGGPVVDWYETVRIFRPIEVFRRPSFTVAAQRKERFEDGEAIEWTLRLTVKRIRYRLIDCKTAPGC